MSTLPAPTIPAPRVHAKRDLFDALKIGTCITSSWFALGVAAYYSLAPFALTVSGLLAQAAISATTVMFGLLAYKMDLIKRSKDSITGQNFYSFIEAPSSNLKSIVRSISDKLGFKKPVPAHFLNVLNKMGAFSTADAVYVTKAMFRNLDYAEREFLMAHEVAHKFHKDITINKFSKFPAVVSMAMAPSIFCSTLASLVGTTPFPGAVVSASLSGMIGASLLAIFTQAANMKTSRIKEYRADRTALETTGNPIAAISYFAKMDESKRESWYKAPFESHPCRNDRVLNIIAAFNSANPDHSINVQGFHEDTGTPVWQPARKAPILAIDARKYDGHLYLLNPRSLTIII